MPVLPSSYSHICNPFKSALSARRHCLNPGSAASARPARRDSSSVPPVSNYPVGHGEGQAGDVGLDSRSRYGLLGHRPFYLPLTKYPRPRTATMTPSSRRVGRAWSAVLWETSNSCEMVTMDGTRPVIFPALMR